MNFLLKSTKLALSAAVLMIAGSAATGTAMAQCNACVNSVKLPTGNVTFSSEVQNLSAATDPASSKDGYFSYTISGLASGTALANASYPAWCGAWFFSPAQSTGTPGGSVYSSYAPGFPGQPIVSGNTINMVNYILNHKVGTVQDVQDAIWLIMTGYTENPASTTAQGMATAAQGNPAYVPDAFGIMAVLYALGPASVPSSTDAINNGYLQSVLLELSVPMIGSTNTCDSCVTNLKVPTMVQYTVTQSDDDYWCSKVSTTTSSITVTGVPGGYNVSNKAYSVWNAGWWTSNVVTGRSGFPAYSTYAANYPAGLKPIVAGNTINMVNYILNNKLGTTTDIQNAIYKIMVGSTPAPLTAAGNAMVAAALLNPNYCPPANGTIVAVIAANSTIAANATIADPQNMPLFIELVCAAPPPTGTPSLSLKKTANVAKANPFQKVTYTYVVTNTGTVTLNNIVVVDDNATPGDTKDDFTVGTVASLAPGASSAPLTATVTPPVIENAQQDGGDWGSFGNYGGHNWNDDGSNSTSGGTLICKETPEGNLHITYRQSTSLSDNTYGRGSSSEWGWLGHSFQNFVNGTDGAQFQILDKSGNVVLDFVADYISPTPKTRSGYGSLGVKGGGGMVYKGNPAHVLRCDSSLSKNLNRQTKYNKSTSDSPNAADWDNEQSYTVVIDKASCGNGGFGGVKLPKIQNDKCKQSGNEKHTVHPVSSVATNTATATATFYGTTVKATAKASVTIDASSSGWSQCSKY